MLKQIKNNELKDFFESNKYILIDLDANSFKEKVNFKDQDGYYYYTNANCIKFNHTPKKFHQTNPYTIQNIKLWISLNNKPFELVSEKYESNYIKLKFRCLKNNCGEIFETKLSTILRGHGCIFCIGHKVGLSNCLATIRPDIASEWHSTKNGDLTPFDVTISSAKYAWFTCKNGHEWKSLISNRTSGYNCPYCCGNLPTEENNLFIINPELCKEWDYDKNKKHPREYTSKSGQKVWWKCKDCNHSWKNDIKARSRGSGCPRCNKSRGEIRISTVLDKLNLFYIKEYSFIDLRGKGVARLRFDFAIFLNKMLYCLIEYDGEQHFEWKKGLMKKEEFDDLQIRDHKKDDYCYKNKIKLIRIPYWDFDRIEEIIENELKIKQVI